MKTVILQHTAYNVWANTKLVKLLKDQTSLLDVDVKSSFPSIRKTMFHIWDAEYIWLQRLKGLSIADFPSKQFPANTPLDKMIDNSVDFNDFVSSKNDDYFLASTEYKNIKGDLFSTSNHGIIMHCMNHSTFHRGQVVTMLRGLGVTDKIDSTDLISYLRE